MSMHVVKSVGVLSIAKIMGLVYGCMGLIVAPLFLLISMIGAFAGTDKNPFAGAIGIVMAVAMPIFYGIFGFIAGAIGGLLYNLFANAVGGVQLDLEIQPAVLSASYPPAPAPLAPLS
jgi:hypothetical protein